MLLQEMGDVFNNQRGMLLSRHAEGPLHVFRDSSACSYQAYPGSLSGNQTSDSMAYYVNKLPCSGNLMMAAMIEAQSGYPQETTRQNGWAVMLMTLVPQQLGRPCVKAFLDTAADAVLLFAREKRENPGAGVVVGKKKTYFYYSASFPFDRGAAKGEKDLGGLVF